MRAMLEINILWSLFKGTTNCVMLRFTTEMEGSGQDDPRDAGKRPNLVMTNKWFVEECNGKVFDRNGRVRPIAYLAEKSRYFYPNIVTRILKPRIESIPSKS